MSQLPQPDALARLRAANPAVADPARGHSEPAQATLQRILEDPTTISETGSDARGTRRTRGGSRRGLAIVLATMLVGGGAAFGAADPLGWWSANRGEARYEANPALRVRTPTVPQIGCRAQSPGEFRCTAWHSGQRYSLTDAIRPSTRLTRARLTAATAQALTAGKITRSQAARFRADLAAVPDSFFGKFQLASRFGTYSGGGEAGDGGTLVPPPGVPEFLVCENAGTGLSCQDLNGDNAAPLGAGVYMAEPTAGWRPAPPSRQNFALPPGITFTPAEYRLLIDLAQSATVSRSSSSGAPAPTQANRTARQPKRQ